MPSFNTLMALLVLFIMFSYLSLTTQATASILFVDCTNNGSTFYPNSSYQSDLDAVFSSLSSDASSETNFNSYSSASASGSVYGIYQCRGDVDPSICHDCVAASIKEARNRCPQVKEAVILYDECMLRYSNRSFASTLTEQPLYYMWNTLNVTVDTEKFKQKVNETMYAFASDAARGAKKYLTRETNFSTSQTIYSLAQCTEDLSSEDCTTCLVHVIKYLTFCCGEKQGGRCFSPSCNVRYDFYPFTYLPSPTPSSTQAPVPDQITRSKGRNRESSLTIIAIVIPLTVVSIALLVTGYGLRLHKRARNQWNSSIQRENGGNEIPSVESLQFDLKTVQTATESFSENYKLGKGGFGEVYKGILPNGQEIAVKRLSKSSMQGEEEFKNEVVLVAKLQHRNLVRLLGFCLEGGEKLLVYEFVPNKSLDYLLFDPEKQGKLDWSKRRKIIGGIARGILYLHEDSRLRIIHRDLKASNILLDADMNPKVSDFGMARMFGIDQTEGNTARIVGTYGYMAPEYAMEGLYSIKSDVFSFGVLLLEILNGRKNSGFHLIEFGSSLLIYAWNLWNEGKVMALMDPLLKQSCTANEFMRYVHIGLLCVQEDAYDRPTMSSVLLMLTTETISLSKPERPAFAVGRNIPHHHLQHQLRPESSSSDNALTISTFVPR